MVSGSFKNPNGSRTWVGLKHEDGGITFHCETGNSECVHRLNAEGYERFLEALGKPVTDDVFAEITRSLRSSVKKVHRLIHTDLTTTDFTWG